MKKLFLIFLLLISLVGCSQNTTSDSVNKSEMSDFNNNGLSFSYPSELQVTVDDFDPISEANIFVDITSISDFIEDCVDTDLQRNPDKMSYEVLDEYKLMFKELKEKGGNNALRNFDNLSCGWTTGNIYTDFIKVDEKNAVLHHKALAQDVGGLDVFYTQVIAINEYDQLYCIVFSYDFGKLGGYFDNNRNEFGTVSMTGEYKDVKEKWDNIVDFFSYETPIVTKEYKGFEENKNVIDNIIKSIKIE